MLLDVINASYVNDYNIYLEFEDGSKGIVDLTDCANDTGIFMPLKNMDYFRNFTVDSKIGTIAWENGADVSPEFLYDRLIASKNP